MSAEDMVLQMASGGDLRLKRLHRESLGSLRSRVASARGCPICSVRLLHDGRQCNTDDEVLPDDPDSRMQVVICSAPDLAGNWRVDFICGDDQLNGNKLNIWRDAKGALRGVFGSAASTESVFWRLIEIEPPGDEFRAHQLQHDSLLGDADDPASWISYRVIGHFQDNDCAEYSLYQSSSCVATSIMNRILAEDDDDDSCQPSSDDSDSGASSERPG